MSAKTCSKCKVEKGVSEFHKRSDRRCGLASRCKSCEKADDRALYNLRRSYKAEPTISEKKCGSCNVIKSACDFRKSYGKANLLRSYCTVCENAYSRVYNRNKRATDKVYKDHLGFRRLIRNYRTVSATDDEIDSHRLVSKETYSMWLEYQKDVKSVVGPIDIDHTFPDSKFDFENELHRQICTKNIVNLSPMNASENRSKGCKIIIELIENQITLALRFLDEAGLDFVE